MDDVSLMFGEQPALYYITCLGVQVFVTSDLGVAAHALWGSYAMTQVPVSSDIQMQ